MSLLNNVETILSITGKKCHFVKLELTQEFNKHHKFEIEVDYEELDVRWMEDPTKVIQLIGEEINITMTQTLTKEENLFIGIITDISMVGHHGEQNNILISGYSPTIKLDGVKTLNSFTNSSLSSIAKEAVQKTGNGAEVTIKPAYGKPISYLSQYDETAFEFLNRLSWLYGEWFFFDGTKTYFGKPSLDDEVELIYDVNMDYFNLTARLLPSKINRYDYLTQDDKEIDSNSPDSVAGVRGYIKAALDKSNEIYTSSADSRLESMISSKKDLDDLLKVDKSRAIGSMLILKGEANTCKVKIGKIVNIKLPSTMKVSVREVESFLVTKVVHIVDQKGYYKNTFSGIPSDMENVPMEAIQIPIAAPQMGLVKDNADPSGRVKVQFQWQKKNNKATTWLRVQTPDAGSSEKVSTNRGFVFVPEVGDMVMVGFEYGDPSRPFVMGSLLTSKTGTGGGAGNNMKSLTTRSGSMVALDDATGSVRVADQTGGNSITADGTDTVSIISSNKIILSNGKSSIIMEGDSIIISSKEIALEGENIVISGSKVAALVSGGQVVVASSEESTVSIGGTDVSVGSKNKIDIGGGVAVGIYSPKITISGDANVDITGGLVKINS